MGGASDSDAGGHLRHPAMRIAHGHVLSTGRLLLAAKLRSRETKSLDFRGCRGLYMRNVEQTGDGDRALDDSGIRLPLLLQLGSRGIAVTLAIVRGARARMGSASHHGSHISGKRYGRVRREIDLALPLFHFRVRGGLALHSTVARSSAVGV